MNKDLRSTVRVSEKTIQALGSLAIKGTESLYDKDSTPTHGPPGGNRISQRELQRIRDSLTDREREIISSVKDCRLITTKQLQRLHFSHSPTPYLASRACRRTLQKLTDLKMLSRRDRRIGGVRRGSASYIYSLGVLGARVTLPYKRLRTYISDPSDFFIMHTLEEAEFYTTVHEVCRIHNYDLLEIQTEPNCWRYISVVYGKLRPDMFIRVATTAEEYSFFIEIDRGSTHLPAILKKARQYEAYFRTGIEQSRHGVFPKVVWVVPDKKRASEFDTILHSTSDLTKNLFGVVTSQEAVDYLKDTASLNRGIAT